MKITISLNIVLTEPTMHSLERTQEFFANACNLIIPFAQENRCFNRVKLHHLSYYSIRKALPDLGSQMVCNAIRKVCAAYKVLKVKKSQKVQTIAFRNNGSVHYCARTFSIKNSRLSLFTVDGRIQCAFKIGAYQEKYLSIGKIKEGELVRKGKRWFFKVVLDIPDVVPVKSNKILAIDAGENNLATTSKGSIYGGGKLRHERDKFLNKRRKLQSNGSPSARRCFKRISGKERRRVKETNHIVSKQIIEEAVKINAGYIVLENLTNIRKRIKGNKRMRSRLHRWAWRELQQFIKYKAQAKGITVLFVNPAYSSQICSKCDGLGSRHKHNFKCLVCGCYQHSDLNSAINLLKLGESVVSSMAPVNMPMVATA